MSLLTQLRRLQISRRQARLQLQDSSQEISDASRFARDELEKVHLPWPPRSYGSRRRPSTQLSCFLSLLHQNYECLLKIPAKRHNASFVSGHHEELSSVRLAGLE